MFVKQREKAVGVGGSEKVVPVQAVWRAYVFAACDAKDQFVFGLVHFVKKNFSRKDAKRCRVAGGLPLRLAPLREKILICRHLPCPRLRIQTTLLQQPMMTP